MERIWRVGVSRPSAFLFISEAVIIYISIFLAITLRFGGNYAHIEHFTSGIASVVITQLVALFYLEAYGKYLYDKRSHIILFWILVQSVILSYALLVILYYLYPKLFIGRGIMIIHFFLVIPFLYGWRLLFPHLSSQAGLTTRAVILDDPIVAADIEDVLGEQEHTGYDIVKRIKLEGEFSTPEVLQLLEQQNAKTIIVPKLAQNAEALEFLWQCHYAGYQLLDGIDFYEWLTGKVSEQHLTPDKILPLFNPGNLYFTQVCKRFGDVFLSLILIALTLPFQIIVAVLIKSTSRGPVFYHQTRTGLNDKPFELYKYRSMTVDAEAGTGPQWATVSDPRITPIGRFLRLSRFDELPQIFNVMKGEMSLIGPRPERPYFTEMFKEKIPYYFLRHSVRPGLTGWAQVRYQYSSSFEDTQEKFKYDLYYIKNYSLSLDCLIFFKTVKVVLTGQGAK